MLVHALTGTRGGVLHGSNALRRAGFRVITYDARGHGASAAATDPTAYTYADLAGDLTRVIAELAPGEDVVLAGSSMGAHTIATRVLADPSHVRGCVFIGPASLGEAPGEDSLAGWDRLAAGLEKDGVEGFIAAYDHDLDPAWRETLLRITRERLDQHHDLAALAAALRVVARSVPFDGEDALGRISIPALVVGSNDEADRGHPYAVAERWAELIENGVLVTEEPGESPLAWQGGKLARAIAAFIGDIP